jgi:hypothetical protein
MLRAGTARLSVQRIPMSQMSKLPQVLTIDEVAAYLRLPKETVERQAVHGQIPGRCIETT